MKVHHRPLTVLLTWELGDDLGHLGRLLPLAAKLQQRGHRVLLAARNLRRVGLVPPGLPVLPAPGLAAGSVADRIREPATFADILYNEGFTLPGMLDGAVRAWRDLISLVQPDIVVQDFSPSCLLALQGLPIRSVLLGTGFACPPDTPELPDIRAWQNHYPERLQLTEQGVLEALNHQLERQRQPHLASIGELYTRVDANCLATFAELDHYPQRPTAPGVATAYCGVWSGLGGRQPNWPEGEGQRIFAYLKPFRGLNALLSQLQQSGHRALVYLPGEDYRARWQSDSLRIEDAPLDLEQVGTQCDLALLHAGHGSTATMLLAGKPVLQLPMNVEQYHTAQNTERLGAGLVASLSEHASITTALERMLASKDYRRAAADFSSRYSGYDSRQALAVAADRILACVREPKGEG
ncbi:glycosyltransferase [Haliea sp.]